MTSRRFFFGFWLAGKLAVADAGAPPEAASDDADSQYISSRSAAAAADASHVSTPETKSVYVLEGVEIRGNERTLSRVISGMLPWAPGDRIDPEDRRLLRARFRLLATGYFREVELSLRRGSRRGHVVLVVHVQERNTLIIESLVAGVGAHADGDGRQKSTGPFGGVELVETNLAGTGVLFGGAAAIAEDQHALRLRLGERGLLATGLDLEAAFLTAAHKEAFGTSAVLTSAAAAGGTASPAHAIYTYRRVGASLGASMRLDADWTVHGGYRIEHIDAPEGPSFASEIVDGDRVPLETHLLRRASSVGVLSGSATYDSRDSPAVPSRGILARVGTHIASAATASDYPYAKIEGELTRWFPLPWRGDGLRLHAFAGFITGSAPLYERFNVGDLSDLLPDRLLGLTVDQRSAPNFFGTRIGASRWGSVAAKVSAEYAFRVYRGGVSVESVDLYLGAGAYFLDDPAQLLASARPPLDRSLPIDLTFDAGLRMVTNVGVFGFGLSNWLGLFPTELRP